MHTLFLLFFFISWAPQQLALSPNNNRRILHEPIVPLDTLPPSEPPIPPSHPPPSFPSTPSTPNPKYPFSTTATPNQSPFFPFYPSPPPPPPPPSLSTFASFPANISSLVLPQSPKTKSSSRKLLPIAITSVACATIVVAISAFIYYRRRQKKHYATDDKAFRSESSLRLFPPNAETANGSRKLRHTSSTSSEFLYLGTVINSRGIDDAPTSRGNGDGLVPQKMDSPELQPLPPLVRQVSTRQARVDVGSTQVDDEQEEFYSPRGSSLGGRESSSGGTGSGSLRVYSAIAAENFAGRSGESSSNSYSSSTSASPERSHSISLSPPAISSPARAQLKASETIFANVPEPPPPPALPPQPQNVTSVADGRRSLSSTSMLSSPERNHVLSPALSPVHNHYVLSPSSKGALEKNAYASPSRLSNATLEKNEEMPRLSNALSSSSAFSLPSSPEKAVHPDSLDQSPRMSTFSDRFRQPGLSSMPLSPALLSSPERELNDTSNEKVVNGVPQWKHLEIPVMLTTPFGQSATIDNVLDQIAAFPAPPPMQQRKHWEIPVLSIPIGPSLRVSPPPPPPPPPPPLQRQRKQWEVPAPSTPFGQTIWRPPELVPPSRPFVLQNTTTKVSPVELLAPRPPNLDETEEASRPKLKPLHWDKVRASSDREMVWDQLKSSSFKLNEEMIETLFVVNTPNPKPKDTTPCSVLPQPSQEDKVLDPKKSQNIAILLRALNVTIEEVCEALLEGGADTLGTELLESLLRMAPSKEEERKLKEHKDDSPTKLGPAEKFLKAVLNVPFAFKRVEAMLYIVNFESEVEYLRKSFQTLEAACEELRNCRMFLKLLEAVLKTGNRMNVGTNRGDAQAFKLDTLLKLADVKGADGKTTLLHFVVQEIIRTEGARLSGTHQTPSSTLSEDVKCRRLGLQIVSSLSSELANVKKAAVMDSEVLSSDVSKLSKGIAYIAEVVKVNEMEGSDESSHKFTESMNKFIRMAEEEIPKIQAQESVALSLVKEITEYFHGNLVKEEAHPFRIFMVVRDFLTVLDRVCREVGMINERTMVSSAHKFPVPVNPMLPQPLPGLHGRQQYNSSDDDSPPP